MTDDGQNKPKSVADALAESAAAADDQEDATVQISSAELAAIRQSASNPALTPEVLREMNRRRKEGPPEDEDDATQTFDRSKLSSLLQEDSSATEEITDGAMAGAAVEEARQASEADPQTLENDLEAEFEVELDEEDFLGDGLDDLSDADLHAVVFGDSESEITLEPDSEPDPEPDTIDGDADIEALDDDEFDELAMLTEDDEDDEALVPADPAPARPPEPQPAPQPAPAQPAPPQLSEEDLVTDFRGTESRLMSAGATLGGLGLIAAGVARLATEGTLTMIHPTVAGMMIFVGGLFLLGVLVYFLQRRQ